MTTPKSNPHDQSEDGEQHEARKLETLTRNDDWGSEAFRDAGEVTFGNP